MSIHGREYTTVPLFELFIDQKRSVVQFHKYIGFGVKRKQKVLVSVVDKILSNILFVSCVHCKYRVYRDIFSGRTKDQKSWGAVKLSAIRILGQKGELGSRELRKLLNREPRKRDVRLNHHYELIERKRVGGRGKTEWIWKLNEVGVWI